MCASRVGVLIMGVLLAGCRQTPPGNSCDPQAARPCPQGTVCRLTTTGWFCLSPDTPLEAGSPDRARDRSPGEALILVDGRSPDGPRPDAPRLDGSPPDRAKADHSKLDQLEPDQLKADTKKVDLAPLSCAGGVPNGACATLPYRCDAGQLVWDCPKCGAGCGPGFLSPVCDQTAKRCTLTLKPSADAYTHKWDPTVNHGTDLLVKFDPGTFDGYVKHDLSAVPPSAQIDKAMLLIEVCTWGGSAVQVEIAAVTATWAEGAITYANAPGVGSKLPFQQVGFFENNLDVTALIQACRAQGNCHGLRLHSDPAIPGNASVRSREETTKTESPAELTVTFH